MEAGLFDRIAPVYDRMNRILSLGMDLRWRRVAAGAAAALRAERGAGAPADILDLAAGTGDFAIALARRFPSARVCCADISAPRLEIARRKAAAAGMAGRFSFRTSPADALEPFAGLVACGGFSYGDVLGAGSGWARSILFNPGMRKMFADFFERPDTFSLGVCNGCQMLSQLKNLIPGARHWPAFRRNTSEQFEARFATVEILPSPSIFFAGMESSRVPIAVAHGEGRVEFASPRDAAKAVAAARYVDGRGRATETYPLNPNGSAGGLTAFTSDDGRATIMMPHPERGFRACQLSYNPGTFKGEAGPWMRMFRNAYEFAVSR